MGVAGYTWGGTAQLAADENSMMPVSLALSSLAIWIPQESSVSCLEDSVICTQGKGWWLSPFSFMCSHLTPFATTPPTKPGFPPSGCPVVLWEGHRYLRTSQTASTPEASIFHCHLQPSPVGPGALSAYGRFYR